MEQAFQDLNDWLSTSKMPRGKKNVLQAAIKLFSEQGYDATSTAQIAEVSGMSQATIFKYFKSKDELLHFIIEPLIDRFLPNYGQKFAKAVKSQDGNLEMLVHFIVTDRFNFLMQNKDVAMILISQVLIKDDIKLLVLDKVGQLKGVFVEDVWLSLKKSNELRDDLDMMEFVRLVVGQILVYFIQSQRIVEIKDTKQIEHDLSQIEKSILLAIRK